MLLDLVQSDVILSCFLAALFPFRLTNIIIVSDSYVWILMYVKTLTI